MAVSSKSTLSNPPYNEKIITEQGTISLTWMRWYMDLMSRVGGYNGRSATQLQTSIENNTSDINTLATNIEINADNITTLNKLLGDLTSAVDTLKQTQNNDHESIVANSSSITEIKEDITDINTAITTINQAITDINTKITALSNSIDKLPFTQVTTLPTGSAFINKIIYYSGNLCYSIDGTTWKKISDNSTVS